MVGFRTFAAKLHHPIPLAPCLSTSLTFEIIYGMSVFLLSFIFHEIFLNRYRTANLLLFGIMPGPKEPTPDQCQRFLRIIVNELLRLWRDGVLIPTPSCPAGRLIRVILICICCDKPAAHKMGGFGAHSHTFFCTRCWIKQAEKSSPESFRKNGA